LKKFKSIL